MNDVRKMVYGTLVAFLSFIVLWLGFIYISACGFTLTCIQGAPLVERTPIPTLIPRANSQAQPAGSAAEFNSCKVAATDLIGGWVSAGHPETETFPFTDLNGQPCEGTFARDIQPLFVENSLWYPGALGCVSCHNSDLSERSAGLDLTSYEAMLMGSRRADATAQGNDIFGAGDWEESLLHDVLVNQGLTPQGHSSDVPLSQAVIYAGQLVAEGEATVTPTP